MLHESMLDIMNNTDRLPDRPAPATARGGGIDTLAVARRALERIERIYTEQPSRRLRPVLRDLRAVVAELGSAAVVASSR